MNDVHKEKAVHFWFDVVCPYAYLASTQIERVAREGGARLVWRPMLLGGVFRAIGSGDRPAMNPPKARMNLLDMGRWAEHWAVELSMPLSHPRKTVAAMRLLIAASDEARPALAHALFRAYWTEGRDVADPVELAAIASAHGASPEAMNDPRVKDALRAATDEAVGLGIFGAPSFVVDNGAGRWLFFGQDRLHFVEKTLAGWEPPK